MKRRKIKSSKPSVFGRWIFINEDPTTKINAFSPLRFSMLINLEELAIFNKEKVEKSRAIQG
jgi:hypothetical protein